LRGGEMHLHTLAIVLFILSFGYQGEVEETPYPVAETTTVKTPELAPFDDGTINCPGSIALMYHKIVAEPEDVTDGYGITTDINTFDKIVWYLVEVGYYFPTPEEFAQDMKTRVCREKYAIITIDDSWNDPEKMGVNDVLKTYGGGSGIPGSPKVWLGIVSGGLTAPSAKPDLLANIRRGQEQGLVYPVSHSRTHPAILIDPFSPFSPVNDSVYAQIAGELGPSRRDVLNLFGTEPFFFIYPGGNVTRTIMNGLAPAGYSGAFTVTPAGLHRAYPYLLPRINAGYGCDNKVSQTILCVISKINKYSHQR